jgi:hypothetical protein
MKQNMVKVKKVALDITDWIVNLIRQGIHLSIKSNNDTKIFDSRQFNSAAIITVESGVEYKVVVVIKGRERKYGGIKVKGTMKLLEDGNITIAVTLTNTGINPDLIKASLASLTEENTIIRIETLK